MSEHAARAAQLQVENETLRAECELLRAETARLAALQRTAEARLAIAEVETDRLRRTLAAIERSRPWRAVQSLRAMVGRRW